MAEYKPRCCVFCVYRRHNSRLLDLVHFPYRPQANSLGQASSLCPCPSHGCRPSLSRGEMMVVRAEFGWRQSYSHNPVRPNMT